MKTLLDILMVVLAVALLWADDAEEVRSVGWKNNSICI
jgi:hypothetical protein